MFELYKSNYSELGTLVEVSIDAPEGIIKRCFKEHAIIANGSQSIKTQEEVEYAFQTEVYWITKLKSEWIPKTLDIDFTSRTIMQEYTHPDLLSSKSNLKTLVPGINEQILEMYRFFKKHNVYKRNGSLSNLTLRNKQIVAFDFKWALERPNGIDLELKSYRKWLSKIDDNLESELIKLL